MFCKILVAMDTSSMGKSVFDEALTLAKATGASLMLLHVLSPEENGSPSLLAFPNIGYYSGYSSSSIDIYQKQWQRLEQYGIDLLRSRQEEATKAGVTTEFTQNPGSPGRTICDVARTWGADTIVMGRRGHSGLTELILGSVSNYVLHHAPCSVLTVQHTDTNPEAVEQLVTEERKGEGVRVKG